MTLYASSTGLVLEAATSPTPSSVNSTHLAHISPNPSPESAIDNPPKDALLKLARTRTSPAHVPDSTESTPTPTEASKSRPTSLTPLFTVKGGKLQHAYPRSLAPYPSNYDRSVIDCDVLDQTFLAGLQAGNPSMLPHVDLRDPTTHPRKTLDLGCGSGAWIISAASLWPQTRFVGFDLVPQIANLSVFEETSTPNSAGPPTRRFSLTQRRAAKSTRPNGSHNDSTRPPRRLSDRVRFVYGNFLINGLPFEDGEFDHVRIAGIARGVPENKWDCLLAEVHRVLCNGGHLEMIEEDIIFPILPRPVDAPAQRKPPDAEIDAEELFYRRPTHVLRPSTSSVSTGSSSSSNGLHMAKKEDDMSNSRQSTLSRRTSAPPQSLSAPIPTQDPSAGTYTNFSSTGSGRSLSVSKKPRTAGAVDKPLPPPPSFKSGTLNNFRSHPDISTSASLEQMSSHSGDTPRVSGTRSFKSKGITRPASAQNPQKPSHNVHSMALAIIGRRPLSPKDFRQLKKEWIVTAPPSKQPLLSKAPRSQSVEAVTRHEHAVLEVLFNSVFEGRFINTSPTAILPSYLNTYFKNLVASPRVDMPTPPAPEGRFKDIFGTEEVNIVPLKAAFKGPLQQAPAMVNRYPAPQTCERPQSLSRSTSISFRPTEQPPRPRADFSASSESEGSDFTYWSTRSLATPTTPPEQLKGVLFFKGEGHPGENNKKEFPSLSLLTMFDEEDDAREAITSPTSKRPRPSPETEITQADDAPITLDAALAAIERHNHFYNEPLSASRRPSGDAGSFKRAYQRKPTQQAERHVYQSHTRVKARDSAGTGLCLVLPRALFRLDERDMALHLRKTYMGVIACREAMWEELQRRAKTVTDDYGVSYRTTLLDHVQWSSQERLMNDAEKFDLLFKRFENDMRGWCSVGPSLSEQLWTQNDLPFAVPQPKGLKRKVCSKTEFNEPLVGRDISRIFRVFVAHKLEDGPPLGRRGSRP